MENLKFQNCYLLNIEHEDGIDNLVFSTEEKAEQALLTYVNENWHKCEEHYGKLEKFNRSELFSMYFHGGRIWDEYYSIDRIRIDEESMRYAVRMKEGRVETL